MQEQLEQERERAHGRQLLHQAPHVVGRLRTVGGVEADVEVQAVLRVLKLDDGHLGLADDLQGNAIAHSATLWNATKQLPCPLKGAETMDAEILDPGNVHAQQNAPIVKRARMHACQLESKSG